MISTPVNISAATAQAAQPADAGQPVQAAQALPAALPAAGTGAAPAPAVPVAAFAQWLGQQIDGAVPAAGADAALPPATRPQAGATRDAGAGDTQAGKDDKDAAAQDGTLLAAMAMPLMPLTPTQIAQALQVAQGNFGNFNNTGNPGATTAPAASNDAGKSGTSDAVGAATAAAGQAGIAAVLASAAQAGTVQASNVQAGAVQAGAAQAAAPDKGRRADAARPQANMPAVQPSQPDSGAARLALQSAAGNPGNPAGGGAADSGAQDGGADNGGAQGTGMAQLAGAVGAAPASNQPAADTVKLAGPPTAWRQSLQEALGDRLHLQVGKNMEQATIRLEPPQLGRIDIAIRHSNGTLEVNISATHSEVLRQLQTVSDNLRSDLSQRQYTEVAVSVTPTPKNNNAAPFSDPQQGGRGRQQGRDQDEPGRALAEAGKPAAAFSLGAGDA